MKKTVLIQLIGEQTLPNILPVHILQPEMVYNLYTGRTEKQGQRIKLWIQKKYGKKVTAVHKKLPGDDLYKETLALGEKLMAQHAADRLIVNLTGGTKLMSLAIHQVAEKAANTTVIYVDSEKKQNIVYKVKVASGDENLNWEYAPGNKLGIIDILEVGEQVVSYESIKDWHPLVPAAKAIQRLAADISSNGLNGHATISERNKQQLAKLRRAAMQDPQLAESFAAAGCYFNKHAGNEKLNSTFLVGTWWEVLMADYLERSGYYTEVMCSVQTYINPECGLTDVDVLATDGLTLTSFSCKRTLSQPDSEINKHESRSRKLGGVKAERGIAVYTGTPGQLSSLNKLAKAATVISVTGADVCTSHQDYSPLHWYEPKTILSTEKPKQAQTISALDLFKTAENDLYKKISKKPIKPKDISGAQNPDFQQSANLLISSLEQMMDANLQPPAEIVKIEQKKA